MSRLKTAPRTVYFPLLAILPTIVLLSVISGSLTAAGLVLLGTLVTGGLCGLAARLYVASSIMEDAQSHADLSTLLEKHVEPGRRISILDPYTLLLKRWYFELRIDEEISRCKRYGSPMTLLTMHWSPAEGAAIGGSTEVDLVQTLVNNRRDVDLAARLDDGLYAVCLPHTGRLEAQGAAIRLLRQFDAGCLYVGIADYSETTQRSSLILEAALTSARPVAAWSSELDLHRHRLAFGDLLARVSQEESGVVELAHGETFKAMKARLTRAARRAGLELQVWADGDRVNFKRVAVYSLKASAA